MKKLTSLLLAFVMLLGLAPATLAAQVSDQQVIQAALDFLYVYEGNYGSINKNDNGALSVGKIQWHGANALALVRDVVARNPGQAKEILGEDLYNEVMDSATSWTARILEDAEASALSALLTTAEGKAAQDAEGVAYMTGYIKSAKNLGITDPVVLVYFCDLHNQGGLGMARRVATAAAETVGSFAAITLDDLYQAALADAVAGKYPVRRGQTYDYCKSLGWSSNVSSSQTVRFPKVNTYWQGQFTDVPAGQWYTGTVASAVEFGLMNGQGNLLFNPSGSVTIAEAITMAARIHSIYTNGSGDFEQEPGAKWYQVYLDYAYQSGILTASYYKDIVNQPASRAQFAEIFSKALPDRALSAKNSVADNAIPDVPSSVSYASAVYKLYRAGILTGDENHRFQPQSNITRAEVSAVAARMADSSSRASVTLP